jgi:hypothetical protein
MSTSLPPHLAVLQSAMDRILQPRPRPLDRMTPEQLQESQADQPLTLDALQKADPVAADRMIKKFLKLYGEEMISEIFTQATRDARMKELEYYFERFKERLEAAGAAMEGERFE